MARGCGFLTLVVIVLIFTLCVGLPTLAAVRERWEIANELRNAKSTELVQYNGDMGLNPPIVYAKRVLAPTDFKTLLRALPFFPDIGIWGVELGCIFDPHHRIVAIDASGRRTSIKFCFECDHLQIENGPIVATPFAWRQSLRQFFADQGMRDKGASDYQSDAARAVEARAR